MRYIIFALLFPFFMSTSVAGSFAADTSYESRIREAELAGNREQVAALCLEWYASGDYSTGILNWNYNALMSVDDNAVLFTHTDSDTYPAILGAEQRAAKLPQLIDLAEDLAPYFDEVGETTPAAPVWWGLLELAPRREGSVGAARGLHHGSAD